MNIKYICEKEEAKKNAISEGFDVSKLANIGSRVEERLKKKELSSSQTLVYKNGKTVWYDSQGYADIENGIKVDEGSIYRLASMSKPITGIAAMIGMEQGLYTLEDDISKYVPSMKEMYVGKYDPLGNIVAAEKARPIIIKDLLNHTSGICQGPIGDRCFWNLGINDGETIRSIVPRFNETYLDFQPESATGYSWSPAFDCMAYIIEVTSGMEFEEYLHRYILDPLEMHDTMYTPNEKQLSRIVNMYDARNGKLDLIDMRACNFGNIPRSYKAAGGCMLGTLKDYCKIAHMLLNYGTYGDVKILSEESVRQMSSPSLPSCIRNEVNTEEWGLTMRVILKDSALPKGCFGWSGAYGTHFWIDPDRSLFALYFSNLLDGGGAGAQTARDLEFDVCSAMS